jgi:hypothetical protein
MHIVKVPQPSQHHHPPFHLYLWAAKLNIHKYDATHPLNPRKEGGGPAASASKSACGIFLANSPSSHIFSLDRVPPGLAFLGHKKGRYESAVYMTIVEDPQTLQIARKCHLNFLEYGFQPRSPNGQFPTNKQFVQSGVTRECVFLIIRCYFLGQKASFSSRNVSGTSFAHRNKSSFAI